MTGSFTRISFRTLGTSPKKKRAKMPAETPKPVAMPPLLMSDVSNAVRELSTMGIWCDRRGLRFSLF
jgi:hypothetical protein